MGIHTGHSYQPHEATMSAPFIMTSLYAWKAGQKWSQKVSKIAPLGKCLCFRHEHVVKAVGILHAR